MTPEQLQEIKYRIEHCQNFGHMFAKVAEEDAPALVKEVERLRVALEFYADDENYLLQPLKDEVEGQLMWVTPIAHENYGDRARKALNRE